MKDVFEGSSMCRTLASTQTRFHSLVTTFTDTYAREYEFLCILYDLDMDTLTWCILTSVNLYLEVRGACILLSKRFQDRLIPIQVMLGQQEWPKLRHDLNRLFDFFCVF